MRVVEIDSRRVSNMPKSFDETWIQSGFFEKDNQMMTSVYKQKALAILIETGGRLSWELSNDGDTYRALGKFNDNEVSE